MTGSLLSFNTVVLYFAGVTACRERTRENTVCELRRRTVFGVPCRGVLRGPSRNLGRMSHRRREVVSRGPAREHVEPGVQGLGDLS